MVKNNYRVVDDFQVKNIRVLELDREYECGGFNMAVIEGKKYKFSLNSVPVWVTLKDTTENFKGKEIVFIRE